MVLEHQKGGGQIPRGVVFASQSSQITALVETKRAEESEKFFGVSGFRPKRTKMTFAIATAFDPK